MRTLITHGATERQARRRGVSVLAVLVSLVGLTASIALGYVDARGQDAAAHTPSVETVRPERASIVRSISLVGHVRPWEQAVLYSKVAGYLEWIGVDKGSWVRKGDLLAEIDDPEMRSDFARLRADSKAKSAIYDRLAAAQKNNPDMVSQLEVDRALGDAQSAEAALERLRLLVEYAKIKAPYDGVITDRWVDPGALIQIATSSQTPTARIVRIMNFETVRVNVAIPEPDSPHLKEGQKAVVRVPDLPGEDFTGTVARFAWAIDPATRTMEAEVDVPNSDHRLRPGMFVTVEIELEEPAEALWLPSETILVEGDMRYVWTVQNGQARRVEVRLGRDDGVQAEIITGLTGSESVVSKGQRGLSEGMAVEVIEAAPTSNN